MVDVAQLVERGIVIPVVVGSIPIVHPISSVARQATAQLTNGQDAVNCAASYARVVSSVGRAVDS